MGDPVGEGQPAARPQHAMTAGQDRGLVGDVEERLLADAGVEAGAGEGQPAGVAAHRRRTRPASPTRRVSRAPPAARPAFSSRPTTRQPAAGGQEARGPAEPGAHVEHARARRRSGPAGERLDGGQAAVVVLVELEEIVGAQRAGEPAAPAGHGGQHLGLADGMAVVEVENVHGAGPEPALKGSGTYDRRNRSHTGAARDRMSGSGDFKAGLEDVVVSTSEICFIDGREGRLLYRGYDVNDLVEHSSFEEVVYLLWHGALPTRKELEAHVKALSATATRRLPPKLVGMLRQLPRKTPPMEVAAHRRLGAVGLRSRRRRQLPRGLAAQGPAAHRADAHPGGGLGAHPPGPAPRRAQSAARGWPRTS